MSRALHHPIAFASFVTLGALGVAACAASETALCDDGLRCPLGFECAQNQDVCIEIGGCGNGRIDPGEACDEGDIRPDDGCSATCQLDGVCENGLAEAGEECGEPGLEGVHCIHLGYDYGHLACDECSFDVADCQSFEWPHIAIVLQPLYSVWGSSTDHVFAVGDRRTIAHFDGARWTASGDVENLPALRAVWGTGPDFAMAAADDGRVWRYSGIEWTVSARPIMNGALEGLAGTGPDDVHAVGEAGTFAHYDGSAWSLLEPSPTSAALHDVWASAPDRAFAVGDDGVFSYDGSAWTKQAAPGGVPLHGVWGSGPDRVFAVGASGTIARYDGISWSLDPAITERDLRAITGTGPGDLYAVGAGGIILHYDGTRWSEARPAIDGVDLHDVWAVAPGMVVAVGDRGRLLVRGIEAWAAESVPTDGPLDDMDGDESGLLVAVGASGTVLVRGPTQWTVEPVPTSAWLHGVDVRAGEIYAVGDDWTVLRRSPVTGTWSVQPTPPPTTASPRLSAVWIGPDGAAFAVGRDSVLLDRSDGIWRQIPVPDDGRISGHFNDVTGLDATVYIAGEAGLFRWDGAEWHVLSDAGPFSSVWLGASDTVIAAGPRGRLIGFTGDQPMTTTSATAYDLTALAGAPGGPVYAVGARDTLLECPIPAIGCQPGQASCTDLACAPIAPLSGVRDLRAVWAASDGTLWLLSGSSDIHRLRFPDTN